MFTGIIEAVGEIAALQPQAGDVRVYIKSGQLDLSDVQLGDSIATNGVCLTVVQLPGDGYWADVSAETLSCSSFSFLPVGSRVNLERALTPDTRLGGHLVSGHVDAMGEIIRRRKDARSVCFTLKAPDDLAKYIAAKGSICIDGVSLTVNQVRGAEFDINIVPHTVEETIIGSYQAGTRVNLEVDLIARYLERLVLGDRAADRQQEGGLSLTMLRENGFA